MAEHDEARDRRAVDEWVEHNRSLRIFIFGKTGVGKSSLINTLLGREVAPEGGGIHAETRKLAEYESLETLQVTIANINVTLCDSPGLNDPETDEEQTLKDIQNYCNDVAIDLFVYCTSLTQIRIGQDEFNSIASLTRAIGDNIWKKGLIALTFANELRPPPLSKESLEKYFRSRVQDWGEALRNAVVRAGVNKVDAGNIPVVPTGYRKLALPGMPNDDWFSAFWTECLLRVECFSIPAIIAVTTDDIGRPDLLSLGLGRLVAERLKVIGDSIEKDNNWRTIQMGVLLDLVNRSEASFAEYLLDSVNRHSRLSIATRFANYFTYGTITLIVLGFVIVIVSSVKSSSK